MSRTQAERLKLPPRSTDLSPIENFFHFGNNALREEAKLHRITSDTFQEFKERVMCTIAGIPLTTVNNLIPLMDRRLHDILLSKGNRLKYQF